MNVDFSSADLVAERVWYDASTARLCLLAGGYHNGIPLREIPDSDFESPASISRFSLGQNGTVVICYHQDCKETWLPVDMWLPGGFAAKKGD